MCSALEAFLVDGKAPEGVTVRSLGSWQEPPTNTLPQGAPAAGDAGASAAGPMVACVLVCAHKLRDKRCGVAGPLIMEELSTVCRNKGLQDKVSLLHLLVAAQGTGRPRCCMQDS